MSTNKRPNIPDEAAEGRRSKRANNNRDDTQSLPSPNSSPYSGPPELFDVTPKLPDKVFPTEGEWSYWKTDHVTFINSPAGLGNANWVGKRPLGAGTFGTAGLWELSDKNNVVIERMVVKESKTNENWSEKVPDEVLMMRRMNKTGCRAVPDLIGYKRAYYPEPFLWYTYKNLVKVAAAMRNGPEDSPWGYQVVHRDLKPANSLEDEDNGFPSYPVAKTGDWGLAKKIIRGDLDNPILLRGAGTEAYYAPEQRAPSSTDALYAQLRGHDNKTAPLPKLSTHTNIWGIGAIMFELLTHEGVASYLIEDDWARNEVFHNIPNERNPKYSSALTELIRLCLMPDPRARPNIKELELKIDVRCQTILDAYTANPNLRERDRLYYKGSEINQMPTGNWNSWHPIMEIVQRPSEPPDSNEPENPFTSPIVYPRFPTSKTDGLAEGAEEAQGGGDKHGNEDDGIPPGPRDEGDGGDEADKGDESNGRENQDSSSDSSNNSDTRRRMAAKTSRVH